MHVSKRKVMAATKEFMLGAVKWKVVVDNSKMDEKGTLGLTSFTESTIYLADTHKGKPVPEDLIAQTFYHELVHAILDAIGQDELTYDEKIAQGMGLLLHQFQQTKK
tara:strand:+ start:605 stop:925 length:321 start_codon:yes stop_codon:yes gene_type:complete